MGMLPALLACASFGASSESTPSIGRQIADIMSQTPSGKAGQRFAHAKGIVADGTFQPSAEASTISRAAHFRGDSVPVTVRFSDGASDGAVADNSPDAGPQGMAIRFLTGSGTDIVALSHNGFVVGTPEEFLALLKAGAATDPAKPHPWPIEEFLESHPRALKFVTESRAVPASFATEAFYGNNALRFVNAEGRIQTGRYQIVPVGGTQYLSEEAAKSRTADFLREELTSRLRQSPVQFRLLLQIAGPNDTSNDGSVVWPDDRKIVELGVITVTAVKANSAAAEKELAFDPLRLTDGIMASDDPLLPLRSQVYAISAASRREH